MALFPASSRRSRPARRAGLAALAAALALAACDGGDNKYEPPPPPPVTAAHPVAKPAVNYLELTGSASSVNEVDLVARVPGYLQSVNFEDGSVVKKGDLLFVIEPAPYVANVQLAEATLEEQKAQLTRASEEYKRQERLVQQKATSQADLEKWLAERNSAAAAVDQANANLEIAKINLSYTKVAAPFAGRIGRHLVDAGNLVGEPAPTKLATIEQLDPIYVYFNVDEPSVLRIRAAIRERGTDGAKITDVPVYVGLQTDDGYPHEGKIDFVDTGIDPATGTLEVRANLPNSDYILLPGMFVRVRVPTGRSEHALWISDRALGVDQTGHYVLVVNADDVVEQRTVEIGALQDGMRVITKGLAESDWVIVEGLQRATPQSKVKVQRQGEGESPPAAGAAPDGSASKPDEAK